jgi:hypothetical protein
MKYVLALILPPVAILLSGHLVHAVLNGILFLLSTITIVFFYGILGWAICAFWALLIVATTNSVRQNLHEMHALHQRHDDHPHAPVAHT